MQSAFVAPASTAFWKLRGVFKWKTVAPFVKAVTVQFDPIDGTVTGLREFYRQTNSPKVRKEFPKYEPKLLLGEGLEAPWVKVAFVDGREVQYDAKNQSPNALCEQIYYDCLDLMMADENA